MYPRYEYTNSDSILASAKLKLGLTDTTQHDYFLRTHLIEAAGEIPSFDLTELKVATIEICDHKAKLPCGFIRFSEPNCIRINDEFGGCYYPRTVNNIMFQPVPTHVQAMSNGESTTVDSWSWCNGIQLNGGYIYFSNDINATECHIYYLSVLLDENERPKIPKSHSRVIQAYMQYQWASTFGHPRINDFQSQWANGKKALKGQANLPNVNEKEEIFLIWNTLL